MDKKSSNPEFKRGDVRNLLLKTKARNSAEVMKASSQALETITKILIQSINNKEVEEESLTNFQAVSLLKSICLIADNLDNQGNNLAQGLEER